VISERFSFTVILSSLCGAILSDEKNATESYIRGGGTQKDFFFQIHYTTYGGVVKDIIRKITKEKMHEAVWLNGILTESRCIRMASSARVLFPQ
jgi:hypothetical protein